VISRDRIPIANLVEFTNQVSRWDSLVELEGEQPTREPDGMYLQLYRFSSRFFDDQQSLAMFPFQKLELPITLENDHLSSPWRQLESCCDQPLQNLKYSEILLISTATRSKG
jgi:hypothetical protein